jgi:hypothetical protein
LSHAFTVAFIGFRNPLEIDFTMFRNARQIGRPENTAYSQAAGCSLNLFTQNSTTKNVVTTHNDLK